jgi:lipopolysaccharide biosynthesis glycosyltransferase
MKEISIAVCTDENYALNAAITIYSTAKNLQEGIIKAYIVDGGINFKTKKRIEKILKFKKLDLIWLKPNLSIFDNLHFATWTSKVTHARCLIPDLIPDSIQKILYLDADMLVLKDINKLWNTPFGGKVLLACQGQKYPYVSKRSKHKFLINAGMKPSSPYFNAGLLLINILEWEKYSVLNNYIKLINEFKDFTIPGQDALNVIFENKWKPLDKYWQVVSPIYHSSNKYNKKIAKNANIIHFTGIPPSFPRCNHPKKSLFYKYVYQSGWFSIKEYLEWRSKLLIESLFYIIYSLAMKVIRTLLSSSLRKKIKVFLKIQ